MSGLNQRFAKPPTSAMGSASSNLAPSATWVDGVNGSMLVSKTKGLCSNRSRPANFAPMAQLNRASDFYRRLESFEFSIIYMLQV